MAEPENVGASERESDLSARPGREKSACSLDTK